MLEQVVLFLGVSIVLVPLFRFLKLGSILGYLAAGLLIGPSVMGLVSGVDDILHFAEIGVVLFMFIVGLEMQPSRIWTLRKAIFGLGSAQVIITGFALVPLVTMGLGLDLKQSFIVGFALALSSTAFVIQTLSERGELLTEHGRSSFAILLFQDIAIIPMLAVLPALAGVESNTDMFTATMQVAGAFAGIFVFSRYLLRPIFRIMSATASHEMFVALALFIVLGVGHAMYSVGLSMALGAFMAGVLLADSEYRHQLEVTIEPFKGLLLGLFFIAIGMTIDLGLLFKNPTVVLVFTFSLIIVKMLVLLMIAMAAKKPLSKAFNLAFDLSQGGEFGFVLFTAAVGFGLLSKADANMLMLSVALSMMISPLLMLARDRFYALNGIGAQKPVQEIDDIPDGQPIIVGFGRFGQIVGRVLKRNGFEFTVVDSNQSHVDIARQFGADVAYGDAIRREILRLAGADTAPFVVVAVADQERSVKVIEELRKDYPDLTIYARARNRRHAHEIRDLAVDHIVRDTYHSGLVMAEWALEAMGIAEHDAAVRVERFRVADEALLDIQHAHEHGEHGLTASTADEDVMEMLEVMHFEEADNALGNPEQHSS